jgi:hypothetical protein
VLQLIRHHLKMSLKDKKIYIRLLHRHQTIELDRNTNQGRLLLLLSN